MNEPLRYLKTRSGKYEGEYVNVITEPLRVHRTNINWQNAMGNLVINGKIATGWRLKGMNVIKNDIDSPIDSLYYLSIPDVGVYEIKQSGNSYTLKNYEKKILK